MKKAVLKKGREWPIQKGHLWIFSGAIETIDPFEDGAFLEVHTKEGQPLGVAYFNSRSDIRGRIVSRQIENPLIAIERHMKEAIDLRRGMFSPEKTTGYRLINAEGDKLPGLTVDKYGNVLVMQITTLGMEKIREDVVKSLLEYFPDTEAIYESSQSPSRKREGLGAASGLLWGKEIPLVTFLENGAEFSFIPLKGQKTGFFLDQRETRQLIARHAFSKKVLNAFSYTGGFSVFAGLGGAKEVDSLDSSAPALAACRAHMESNGLGNLPQQYFEADAFEFLEKEDLSRYDMVILDPPAFAKKRSDVPFALKGYRQLNRLAMKSMKKGALLLTCSCSSLVSEEDFQKVIQEAGDQAGKSLQMLSSHSQAPDHPYLLAHPETEYLKSCFLRLI